MMEWTDRHCRFFHRLLTRRALIYTEMVTTGAVLHGDRARLLGFDPAEHPVALQLGGSDPAALAQCARIGADFGYDEINLNVGCPSDRVQEGRFGACLMAEPALVGDCVAAMKAAVAIPVTVKCRIGIDDQDPGGGAVRVHRRRQGGRRRRADRACAQGLAEGPVAAREPRRAAARLRPRVSPQGRASGPADRAQWRHRQRRAGAGGISAHVDGVMMGRAAYQEPWRLLAGRSAAVRRAGAVRLAEGGRAGADPLHRARACAGARLHAITRHLLGLFHAVPGARAFRRHLATEAVKPGASAAVLAEALALVLDRPADLAHIAA